MFYDRLYGFMKAGRSLFGILLLFAIGNGTLCARGLNATIIWYADSVRTISCTTPLESRADGCSVPLNDPESKALKIAFKGACDHHDICYSTLGKKKDECDWKFYNEMVDICYMKRLWDPMCVTGAGVWYQTVGPLGFGNDSFKNDQAWAESNCRS